MSEKIEFTAMLELSYSTPTKLRRIELEKVMIRPSLLYSLVQAPKGQRYKLVAEPIELERIRIGSGEVWLSKDGELRFEGFPDGETVDLSAVLREMRSRGMLPEEEPEPERKPSWDDAPEWANWLAQDADSWWFWFENCPLLGNCSWYSDPFSLPLGIFRGSPNPDWRDTLQGRSIQEQLCPVCGKPESKHYQGFFCCPCCGGKWVRQVYRKTTGELQASALCEGCGMKTGKYQTFAELEQVVNKRA